MEQSLLDFSDAFVNVLVELLLYFVLVHAPELNVQLGGLLKKISKALVFIDNLQIHLSI